MRRFLVGVAALAIALVTTAFAAAWTFLQTCAISDTSDIVPAPASMQGRICDASDHWLNVVPWVVLLGALGLAVVLAVAWWANPRLRWVGLSTCLWLPLLAAGVLALPSDACSDAQRRDLPAYACHRLGNG